MSNKPTKPLLGLKSLLLVLLSVYTIQSLLGMFTLQGIPAVLRTEGVSTSQIGLFYAAMLPWAIKFLWSPKVELSRKQGTGLAHHGYLIFGTQLLIIGIMLFLAKTGNLSNVGILFASVLSLTFISTVADITTDGLAVDQLPAEKRYLGNMMQVGGAYLGGVFGGGLFIYLTSQISWNYGMLILACLVLVISLPCLNLFKQANNAQTATGESIKREPSIKKALSNPKVRLGLLLVALCQLGTRGTLAMMMPFLVDQGINLADLGLLVAGGGVITGLAGVGIGGWAVKRSSAFSVLLLFLVIEAAIFSVLMACSLTYIGFEYGLHILYVTNAVVSAAKFVALYTLMMDLSYGEQSGVDFSLFQSVDMLVAIVMALLCGAIISEFGYTTHFTLTIITTLIALLFISFRKRQHHQLLAVG
ncbi:MFS transporter [Vibrio sp. JC009]|uniref:MFS transporter n=1 Tax=Vibrio sp. JC009 TaxID=2912314 RepID=UPI0023AF7119|nr:MFS transporter [Vibrio sp. JC009]WED23346.1 MFS transporter [Vibrio sp. JC009]